MSGRLTHSSSFEDGKLNGRPRTDCWLDEVSVAHHDTFTTADQATFETAFQQNQSVDLKSPMHFTIEDPGNRAAPSS